MAVGDGTLRGRIYDDLDPELSLGLLESDGPALDGRDDMEGMRPTKGESRDLKEFEVFGLPNSREDERPKLIKQWLDKFCCLSDNAFDWGRVVGTVEVVQAGVINTQHRRGLVEGRANVLRIGLQEQIRLSIGQTKTS